MRQTVTATQRDPVNGLLPDRRRHIGISPQGFEQSGETADCDVATPHAILMGRRITLFAYGGAGL